VSYVNVQARMKQHEIESDDRAAEDREWTVVLQQYLLYRVHTVTLCGWYYSIAVHTTLPMPCLHYATFIHDWSVGGIFLPSGSKLQSTATTSVRTGDQFSLVAYL